MVSQAGHAAGYCQRGAAGGGFAPLPPPNLPCSSLPLSSHSLQTSAYLLCLASVLQWLCAEDCPPQITEGLTSAARLCCAVDRPPTHARDTVHPGAPASANCPPAGTRSGCAPLRWVGCGPHVPRCAAPCELWSWSQRLRGCCLSLVVCALVRPTDAGTCTRLLGCAAASHLQPAAGGPGRAEEAPGRGQPDSPSPAARQRSLQPPHTPPACP